MSNHRQQSDRSGGQPFGWAELGTGESVELARPLARLGARNIDGIIQFLPLSVYLIWAVATADFFFGGGDEAPELLGILGAIWLLGYEFVQIAVWGQTIGKRIVRIKVIRADQGGVPGWGKAISRWIILFLPASIWVIPVFPAFISIMGAVFGILCVVSLTWDRGFQGWHDKAVSTMVVRV